MRTCGVIKKLTKLDKDLKFNDNSLEDHGFYLLSGEFNEESLTPVIRFIIEKNLLPKDRRPENLTLVITSGGGEIAPTFALIDTIKSSKIPVHTVGLGMIGSSALMLFIAGEKGHRVLTPNTSVLSHQWSWGSQGKEHELFAVVKEFTLTQRKIVDHYRKCTGLSDKDIKKYLLPPEDIWLSSKEAVKYKIADSVVTTY